MSRYRRLPVLGHALASRFALSMEHFAWIAMASGIDRVGLDLLRGSIEPTVFDTGRHRLQAVRLVAQFDPVGGNPSGPWVDAFIRVVVTDDRGRDWLRELRVAGVRCSPPRLGDDWPPPAEHG